jgi:hypothetical protein
VKAALFEAWRAHHVVCPERFYGCKVCASLWASYVGEDWKQRALGTELVDDGNESGEFRALTAEADAACRACGRGDSSCQECGGDGTAASAQLRLSAEVEQLRTALVAVLGQDRPWPLVDVIAKLADAADHLLRDHDCDHLYYEKVVAAREHVVAYLANMREAVNSIHEATLRHEALERTNETALELKKLIRQLESDLDAARKLGERRRQALWPFASVVSELETWQKVPQGHPVNFLAPRWDSIIVAQVVEARQAHDATEEKP